MNLFYFHAAHHYFTHLRESCNRRALPPASRPEWFLDYFYTRGISDAIIAESGAIPLTPLPSRAECAAYKRFMHRARLSKETGAPDPIVEGILFPFFVDPVDFGTFGVCRALFLTRKFEEYYEHKGDKNRAR